MDLTDIKKLVSSMIIVNTKLFTGLNLLLTKIQGTRNIIFHTHSKKSDIYGLYQVFKKDYYNKGIYHLAQEYDRI